MPRNPIVRSMIQHSARSYERGLAEGGLSKYIERPPDRRDGLPFRPHPLPSLIAHVQVQGFKHAYIKNSIASVSLVMRYLLFDKPNLGRMLSRTEAC